MKKNVLNFMIIATIILSSLFNHNYASAKEGKEYLGKFKLTAYCSCSKCCGKNGGTTASGTTPKEGRTISVDKDLIPLGSKVIIDGETYIAEDTGGAINGKKIDIYFKSHQDALDFGVQENVKVYLVTE